MKSNNIVKEKSFAFAVRIVRLQQHLITSNREFVLSRQILRSGTSIGANIHEAIQGSSRKDFIHKMNISLKEAHETGFWLRLLKETDYITAGEFDSIESDCSELIRILTAILKTSKITQSK